MNNCQDCKYFNDNCYPYLDCAVHPRGWDWRKGNCPDLSLPPSEKKLIPFEPRVYDPSVYEWEDWEERDYLKIEVPQNAILLDFEEVEPRLQQLFCHGFFQANLGYSAFFPEEEHQGEEWYDALPVISEFDFEIHKDGKVVDKEWSESCSLVVDTITIKTTIKSRDGEREIAFETDVFFNGGHPSSGIVIFITSSNQLTQTEMLDLIEYSFFESEDEFNVGADSRQTQEERFRSSWEYRVMALLLPQEEVIKRKVAKALQGVDSVIPQDSLVQIRIQNGETTIEVETQG